MFAVKIYGPRSTRVEEVPIRPPGLGEALIRVMAAGLCGTDYELYTGEMTYIRQGLSQLPMIPGHEWAGVVEQLGDGVTEFAPGEKVTGECTVNCGQCFFCARGNASQCVNRTETGVMNREGGFAQYITFPVSHLHRFHRISFEEAALIEPTAVALYALLRGKVTPLDNVMVTGPGPVGLQAAQIAKNVFGAKRVILTGTRSDRLQRALDYGLDGCVNIREEDLESRIRALTGGEMIDAVIEESGGATVFEDIKKVINPLGRVVLNGFFGAKTAAIDWDFVTTREIQLLGSLGSAHVWDDVIRMLDEGKIQTQSLISHVLSLSEFEKGLDIMTNRRDNVCKIIFKP